MGKAVEVVSFFTVFHIHRCGTECVFSNQDANLTKAKQKVPGRARWVPAAESR